MNTKQSQAQAAAVLATHLVAKLSQLSELEKWYDVRVLEVISEFQEFHKRLQELGLAVVSPPVIQASPAPQPISTRPAPMLGVKFINVGRHLKTTPGHALYYDMPGFVGGQILKDGRPTGVYRKNNMRPFPDVVILVPRDANGWIGVEETWYNKYEQQDLRNWVKTYKKD